MRSADSPSPGGELYKTIINGRPYEAYLLSATMGNEIFVILVKFLAPILSAIVTKENVSKFKESKEFGDLDIDLKEIAMMASEKLDVDEYSKVVSTMCGTCTCDGKRFEFDGHFRGRYGEMFKVLAWTIQINFEEVLQDFFFEDDSTNQSEEGDKAALPSQST